MKMNFLSFLIIVVSTFTYANAQTVDEIVSKHITAMGGSDRLNAVSSIVIERAIAVQGMEIPNKSTLLVGKSLRVESSVMGNSMVQVVSGDKGWKIMPTMLGGTGEPEDMNADEIKSTAEQLDPFLLNNYQDKGYKVELVGKENIDKKEVYHLKVTAKNGSIQDIYLDAATYLPYKVTSNVNGQSSEVIFSDYQPIEGIPFANTMDVSSPMGVLTMITNKIVVNVPVDEQVFAKPMK